MDERAITLQRLQAFSAVYECGSITGAAKAMSVSQPTVSKHVRDLEAALGVGLFLLQRGRVVPTAEADFLYVDSRFIGEGLRRLRATVQDLHTGAGRRLSVISVGLLAQRHLPRALAALRAAHPALSLDITLGNALEQLAALRSGQADLGFCAGLVEAADLWRTRIGRGKLVLLLPRDHPLASQSSVPEAAVRELTDCIAMPGDRPLGKLARTLLPDLEEVAGSITCFSLEAMLPLCAALGRPAVVDSFTAAQISPDGPLVVRPLDPAPEFNVYAFSRRPPDSMGMPARLITAMTTTLAETQ
ncbi:LysR family transcriptional regulator [Roseibacterium beibuensis]|uniref:HTH lysR-type domain-containing protein n=1 Tax=[Roseibacterium] beibuensis TaxID=1193142 RepID=A0ABP9LC07_9RHOB|nr:LysR family transcriptional regulator [Roseibacterium beibuensis]MCS6623283.1 LysR family transcriptional regulator [Roseibacterium beibuensis]